MRLASPFLVASAASSLVRAAGAIGRTQAFATRGTRDSPTVAHRQYHVPRTLIDTCIYIDARALLPLPPIVAPAALDGQICLCLKDLDVFLKSDIGVLLANLLGESNLVAVIHLLINTSPESRRCEYPPHSHSACKSADPCAYTCDPPYVISGNMCVCPQPFVECNGKCGHFPKGCGTSVPHKMRRIVTLPSSLREAQRTCKRHEYVCGIPGREGTDSFECIDTSSALGSCGGCVKPHPFGSTSVTRGVDCGSLPGVATSRCVNSHCVVTQCAVGWRVNADKSACDEVLGLKVQSTLPRKKRTQRQRDVPFVDSVLSVKIKRLVDAVVNLAAVSDSITPASSHPAKSDSSMPLDQRKLTLAIVESTKKILSSPTVATLVANINALLAVEGIITNTIHACGCAEAYGLNALVASLNVVVEVTFDLAAHGSQSSPISVSVPSATLKPAPNISTAPIAFASPTLNYLISVVAKAKAALETPGLGLRLLPAASSGQLPVVPVAQMNHLSDLVMTLQTAAKAASNPSTTGVLFGLGVTSSATTGVNNIIGASTALLKSASDPQAFLQHLNALIELTMAVNSTLGGCGCVDNLGLGDVVSAVRAILDAALAIKTWCGDHPFGASPSKSSTFGIPSTTAWSHYPTSTSVGSSLFVGDGGITTDPSLDLEGLIAVLVRLVLDLRAWSPSVPSLPTSSVPNPTSGLIDGLVRAVGNLLSSLDTSQLLAKADALLDSLALLGCRCMDTKCGCDASPSTGLGPAIQNDLSSILHIILAIEDKCKTGSQFSLMGNPEKATPIIINAEKLLTALGLNGILGLDGTIDGLLGNGLNGIVNGLLGALGLGGVPL